MRVIIYGPASRDFGGIARYVNEQAEHLREHDVVIHDYSPPAGQGPRWFVNAAMSAAHDFAKYVRYRRPDVVHVHTSHGLSFIRASVYVLFSRYIWRRPVVFHIHGSSFDEFIRTDSSLLRCYQSLVFRASCRLVVLSAYWKDVLSERVDPKKIVIIPNAVDHNKYMPRFVDEAHLVFVSSLIQRKGIRDLVEAIRQLEENTNCEYELTIAGDGPLSSGVKRLASEFGHVHYRGFVTESEKRSLLESGSVFVLPSHAEGLPIAILEGMAGGNVIISTKVGSIPEIITDENGILVEPGSVDELADAIRTVMSDSYGTSQVGQQNRELCEEKFSWDVVIPQLEDVFMTCLQKD